MRMVGAILMAALCMSSLQAKAANNVACIESVAFYEANTEGFEAMLAVASVVINRAKGSFDGVCRVVKQPGQFSWVGQKTIKRVPRAEPIAQLIKNGFVHPRFKDATHFHDTSITPSWTNNKDMIYVGKIKRLKFYRERI